MTTFENIIRRTIDNSYVIDKDGHPYHVPNEGEWSDLWQEIDAYALEHPYEVTTEEPPPPPPEPTPEEKAQAMQSAITAAIQKHLDDFAKTRNYDGILSAATYATSAIPKFQAEGQYAVEARDSTWIAAYGILDEFLSGTRPIPEDLTPEFVASLIAELPALVWPENVGG